MRLIGRENGWGRRGKTAATTAVLALAGAAMIVYAAEHQVSAPSPPPSAAGSITSGQPAAAAAAPAPPSAALPRPSPVPPPVAVPTAITIPAISAQSTLVRLGKNPDGTLQVPDSYLVAGWYTGSVRPGQIGPAVIAGHVDSYKGLGIFFRLGKLRPGDKVNVTRADGSTAVFTVQGVRQYPKTAFPTLAVYGNTDSPALRLITCGGQFDHATGNYLSDVVVFATLSTVVPAS